MKRFSFSLAEFYWMDSSVPCGLLFSGAFVDGAASSRWCHVPFPVKQNRD